MIATEAQGKTRGCRETRPGPLLFTLGREERLLVLLLLCWPITRGLGIELKIPFSCSVLVWYWFCTDRQTDYWGGCCCCWLELSQSTPLVSIRLLHWMVCFCSVCGNLNWHTRRRRCRLLVRFCPPPPLMEVSDVVDCSSRQSEMLFAGRDTLVDGWMMARALHSSFLFSTPPPWHSLYWGLI